jgi:putative membrane protein
MLWLKAFHIIFMVTWFAALFYLPRLFVYHAMVESDDDRGDQRLRTMERKLFWGIMTPGGVLTLAFGIALMIGYGPIVAQWGWLHAKLALVVPLIAYHIGCGLLVRDFAPRFREATEHLAELVARGDLGYRETVTEGLENAPDAFLGLFEGENVGKQVVRVAEPEP